MFVLGFVSLGWHYRRNGRRFLIESDNEMLIFRNDVTNIGQATDKVLEMMELSLVGKDPVIMHNVRRAMDMLCEAYTDANGILVGDVPVVH